MADVLTPPEIASRWRCKPDAVRSLLERGILRGFRVGASHWRVTLAAVEAYERGERTPTPEHKPIRRRRAASAQFEGPF